jgi:hypothetical protein
VWVDRKYDSASTGPLLLDTNRDGSFEGENPLTGFGMHSDTFITFDLAAVRRNFGFDANASLTLTGWAGLANPGTLLPSSAAILADGVLLGVFDWNSSSLFSTYAYTLAPTAQYLTFVGLSGTDADNFYAHVGFANVQLSAVPEPSVVALLGAGAGLLAGWSYRKRRYASAA